MPRRPVIIASLSVLALGTGTQARALTLQQVSSYLEASSKGCTLTSTFPGVVGRVRGSDREVTVVPLRHRGLRGRQQPRYAAGRFVRCRRGARCSVRELAALGEDKRRCHSQRRHCHQHVGVRTVRPALLPQQERHLPHRRHRKPTYHAPLSVRLPSGGFAFLTTEPNAVVAPIHPKGMLVLLTTAKEYDTWLTAPAQEALAVQRSLPDGTLTVVARRAKRDG